MIDENFLVKHDIAYLLRMGNCPDDNNETDQIERLARLGLWAEKHGIPALKRYGHLSLPHMSVVQFGPPDYGKHRPVALEALHQLPKDDKESE